MVEESAKAYRHQIPPMVSFIAPSGTGKTTLLEGVIATLTARGHRIGAVKHDAHRIELDTKGKDSWRLRQAGAAGTALVGRDQLAFFGKSNDGDGDKGNEKDRGGDKDRDHDAVPDLAAVVGLLFADADLVVVEGFRSAGLPTVRVERPDHLDPSWQPPDPAIVLITVGPDEVDRMADLLEQRYLRV